MSPAANFLITLLLGPFGVHKFIGGNVGMGVLYLCTAGLFGIGWLLDTVKAGIEWYKNRSLPDIGQLDSLPVVAAQGIVLKEGELCCYQSPAQNLKVKNVVTGHKSSGSGMSVRIMKGVSIHSGGGGSSVIRQNVEERTPGTLYITNKRVVMLCPKGAFDKPISSLSGIIPYRDGIAFQFGSASYTVLLHDALYARRILEGVINGLPMTEESTPRITAADEQ